MLLYMSYNKIKKRLEILLDNPPLKRTIRKIGGSLVIILGKEECDRRGLKEKETLVFQIVGIEKDET